MKNSYKGKSNIIIMLLVFVGILVVVGLLMRSKMQTLLQSYIEKQVTEQAKVLAEVLEEDINVELTGLRNLAAGIQSESADMGSLLKIAQEQDARASWGIVELGGNVILGDALSVKDFSGIQDSFRGNNAVSYKEGKGVLFTIPIFSGDNIKYVLYKFCPEDQLTERFGMSCYNGQGRILVATRDEQIMVPYVDWKDSDASFLEKEEVKESFLLIREKMNISTAAAEYCSGDFEPQYVFVSEVGDYDFLLVGMVSEAVAAEGISYIITLVLWVFGLLLLLLAIGMVFVFGAEEKARESEELRKAKMIADAANQAKSNFLASMSHEIRTPINAVMGMNEMILRECKDPGIKEYAINIQGASVTLLSLINDILDLSKIEADKMEIVESKYRLSSILNDVVNMIQVKAKQKDLQFIIKVDKSIPDELYGDEVRIRQVIINILNNAIKYTKVGSVTLYVNKADFDGGILLKFAVEDTGIGIREEDMSKLFGSFERLDVEKNHSIEGTGLGLSITSKLVALMNGKMDVESVYGEGSTFSISIPQKVAGEGCIGNFEDKFQEYVKSLHTYKESFIAPDAKILVVDDNEMNIFVVRSLLKKTQVNVSCCMSGKDCLELIQKEAFDVILLDHMMPEMDGIETLKRMKTMDNHLCKKTPVIALTANAILGVREMYLSEGFDDYLSKPIDGEDLESLLMNYIPSEKFVGETMLDSEVGMKYCGDSQDMYQELVKMFCDLQAEKKPIIEDSFEKEDWEMYRVQVHALKSTSLSIGATTLSEAALALEQAAKEGNVDFIKDNHENAMRLYDKTVQEGRKISE